MSCELRLRLFGTPTVEAGGEDIALPFERRHQLVALLALRRGWVPRSEVAALLWPEQESRLAHTNLRKTLFRLQGLPWAAGLESQGAALRFEAATDVADFETACRDGQIDRAVALGAGGDLLSGFDDGTSEAWTRWLGFERERLRAAWRGAALARLAREEAAASALALATQLLERDPLDEAAVAELMRWLLRDGQPGAARAAYRAFEDRLARELGLEPGAELRALHDGMSTPPAGPTAPMASTPAGDGFVGRAVERRRIADLLARDECRLLCLIGPGGVGKTRLARRMAAELGPSLAHGACFVALEDIEAPGPLAARLAREAGAPRGAKDALQATIAALRERQTLWVLDNFEQLVAHAGMLEQLLSGCPQLKLLVTSRVRLALASEWSMPIEGLPFPEPEDDDRAEAFDAFQLFVKSAQRIEPSFDAAAERSAVVDICRQVGGLPLALELAAAWVRVLPGRDIAAELRHGTELLRASEASHPPRHASLEQVFEQSWRRLAAAERRVLARLAVFQGGFSAEAARAVAGASLPVLGALADKSLLRREGARMHLHPLVQQLAGARLDEDERRQVRLDHAAFFHAALARWPSASGRGDREALQAIDADHENFAQAWQASIEQGDAIALRASSPSLLNHAEHRARFEEAWARLERAIDSPLGRSDAALRARLNADAALMQFRLTRYQEAAALAEAALSEPAARRDRDVRYRALSVLASCATTLGRWTEAARRYRQALAQARAGAGGAEMMQNIASTLENLALVEKRLGRYEMSLELSLQALAQHRANQDHAAEALCLSNLGSMHMFMHDDASAVLRLQEALVLAERHGLVSTRAFVLANLTELALRADDPVTARQHAERALEVAESTGLRSLAGWLRIQLARLAVRRSELPQAAALLASGATLALTLAAPALKAAALLALAEHLEALGHAVAARRVLGFGSEEPSISVPDRDELRIAWARRAGAQPSDGPWPALSLDGLLEQVVAEQASGWGSLLARIEPSA